MADIFTQPVEIRRAEFWMRWSLEREVDEILGNQIGAASVMMERMRDLNVMRRVSFCWPQVVPARARRMLRRGVAREMMDEM